MPGLRAQPRQPVIAFVGGLNFELMPAPLAAGALSVSVVELIHRNLGCWHSALDSAVTAQAELDTTVCWPDKQPLGYPQNFFSEVGWSRFSAVFLGALPR